MPKRHAAATPDRGRKNILRLIPVVSSTSRLNHRIIAAIPPGSVHAAAQFRNYGAFHAPYEPRNNSLLPHLFGGGG
jgi:hypothetical protein